MKRKESNLFLYTIYTDSESASPQMVKYSNISFQSLFILEVQGLDTDSPQGYLLTLSLVRKYTSWQNFS